MKIIYLLPLAFLMACSSVSTVPSSEIANEPHRPQIHFTPEANWMNDPNGMVFFNNTYHLFYQYFPDSTVWGPMHWGHATSTDLVHWEHQPVAIYPDSLGYIFSGSAVADVNNTSGFGTGGKTPLVAIYTSHDPVAEKAGSSTFETQSIAYSLDEGKTWTKYTGNPVLSNPGIRDFRDPKVRWYEAGKKWIMTLATQDRVTFFSSKDLKSWSRESDFGKDEGAHGGVWECPDLFPLNYNGTQVWVLLVSINPGGPNGGSATQYFTGDFDGTTFTRNDTLTKWVDYGPDNYAGVTWSNTGDRTIFLGWMSNWDYAQVVPTEKWRSATTVPRDLSLQKINGAFYLNSVPVPELSKLGDEPVSVSNVSSNSFSISKPAGRLTGPAHLKLHVTKPIDFSFTLSNEQGEKVIVGFDETNNRYYVDRRGSGKVDFSPAFANKIATAPRLSTFNEIDLELVIDNSSVELFGDNGLTVMTAVYFPNSLLSNIKLNTKDPGAIKAITVRKMRSFYQ